MDNLTDKILHDLGESWEGVALSLGMNRAAILNGPFIEEFIRLGSYEKVGKHFNIHVQTVAKIVNKLFPGRSYWPTLSHNTWV